MPVSITFQFLHFDGLILPLFISNNNTKKALILVSKFWSFSPHNGLPQKQHNLLKRPLILPVSGYNSNTSSVSPILNYGTVIVRKV